MMDPCTRDAALRQHLAQRLRAMRRWPQGRHRLRRPTEPRMLASVREDAESLSWLIRCTVAGYMNLRTPPAPAAEEIEAVARDDEPFKAPVFEPLSVVLAAAEARGLDLEAVSVHQEMRREPYEDWTDPYLVTTVQVPVDDETYAKTIESAWADYQLQQMGGEREREDFVTFLRLRERFGHLVSGTT